MKYPIEFQGQKTSLLSWTSAMDCHSLSLPAQDSCPGAVFGEGAICQGCYASIGRYCSVNVLNAQWIRYMWLRQNLRTIKGSWEIITTMVNAIHDTKTEYFRFFDSGDVFSVKMAWAIRRICELTPSVKYWMPTRSWHLKSSLGEATKSLGKVPNLVVRPSALYVNKTAPSISGMPKGSGVVDLTTSKLVQQYLCPKSVNGGSCESNKCRSCWDAPDRPVYYLNHGWQGRKKMPDVSVGKIPALRGEFRKKFTQLTVKQKELT